MTPADMQRLAALRGGQVTISEDAKALSDAIQLTAQDHQEYVGQRVDGSGAYSHCTFCDRPWPCAGSVVATLAGACLTQIVAALEDYEHIKTERDVYRVMAEGAGMKLISITPRECGPTELVDTMGPLHVE